MPAATKPTLKSKALAKSGNTASSKRAGKSAPVTGSSKVDAPSISAGERQRLVERAAYFRAEKRGFAPGFELQDWVEAEAEVQRLIGSA